MKITYWISYVEAEGVAAAETMTLDSSTVDIVSHRLEVLTVLISTLVNTLIKCTRRRVSMKLPIPTEARILGVKRPIVKGIADTYSTKKKKTYKTGFLFLVKYSQSSLIDHWKPRRVQLEREKEKEKATDYYRKELISARSN